MHQFYLQEMQWLEFFLVLLISDVKEVKISHYKV